MCPNTCVKNLTYVIGLDKEEWYVINNICVILPFVAAPITVAAKHMITKSNTAGELNVILICLMLFLPPSKINYFPYSHTTFPNQSGNSQSASLLAH
jgi:hypothetical protein